MFNQDEHNSFSVDYLYNGLLITGDSGYGKNIVRQDIQEFLIENGYGLTIIDSEGNEKHELLQKINEKRKDDIIHLKPKKDSVDVGINILNCPMDKSNSYYQEAVSNISHDLTRRFADNIDSWDTSMGNVIYTLIRKFIIKEHTYTITDFAEIVQDKEKREKFLESCDLDSVFFNRIKNQNQEFFDLIAKTVTEWTEKEVVSQFISNKRNDINLYDSIDSNKIIILDTSQIQDYGTPSLISSFFLNRIWNLSQMDLSTENNEHFLFITNYNRSIHDNSNIRRFISHSRSYKLGVCISIQHFHQLPNRQKSILSKLDNRLIFNTGSDRSNTLSIAKLCNIDKEKINTLDMYEFICDFKNKESNIKNL